MNIKDLAKRSKELYPTSQYMARQWVRKTYYLLTTGNHALVTGRFPRKVM